MTRSRPEETVSAPLWERDGELALVKGAVDALCDGADSGSLLVFSGSPGIGKTALLAEVGRVAAGRATVWTARGGETVTSVPFNVIRQLLQPALVTLTPDEAREYLGDRYEIAGPALGIAEPGRKQADPQGVRDGLVEVVTRLARSNWPLILVIDDAHWADQETLHWLAAFAEHLDSVSVLVVVAHRDGEATGESARHLEAIGAAARPRRTLKALGPDAAAGLTRAALGEHADPSFCREVWAVTAGNPYETVELLAKVHDTGLGPTEEATSRLRELNSDSKGSGLIARLERLGPDVTRYAWAAAILGTAISPDLAGLLAGTRRGEARRHAERLRAARILTGDADGDGELDFVHPMIASAIYRAIPSATRTAMHGQAAWAVRHSGLGAADASRHLLKVHPDNDPDTVEQLREAAREHLAVGAPRAARHCLERALREPPQPGIHAQVLYELGCATLLTSPSATVRHLREALNLDIGLTSELRVDAVCRLSQGLVHIGQLGEAIRVVDEEADRLPPGSARMRLQGVHFMWEGMHAREIDTPGRSRRLAALAGPLTGRDNSERALLILHAFDAMTRGDSADLVVELCDRTLVNGGLAPGLGWTDNEWGFELLIMLGGSYAYADHLDRAESLFNEALRVYEESGWVGGHLAVAYAFVGYMLRRRGKLKEAEGYLRESLRLADRVGTSLPMHWDAACMLIDTLLARGRVDEAREAAERYDFAPPYPEVIVLPDAPSVRGRLLMALGRKKEAVEELEAGAAHLASRGWHNTVMAPWAGELALAIAAEDPERAAELVRAAREHAERFGTDTAIGEALRCAAALETGQRRTTLLAKALAYLEASPCAYEHAVARVEYGISSRSRAELTRGLGLARKCGADGLAARAREVLEDGRGLY